MCRGLLWIATSCAKTAEQIKMPFGFELGWVQVGASPGSTFGVGANFGRGLRCGLSVEFFDHLLAVSLLCARCMCVDNVSSDDDLGHGCCSRRRGWGCCQCRASSVQAVTSLHVLWQRRSAVDSAHVQVALNTPLLPAADRNTCWRCSHSVPCGVCVSVERPSVRAAGAGAQQQMRTASCWQPTEEAELVSISPDVNYHKSYIEWMQYGQFASQAILTGETFQFPIHERATSYFPVDLSTSHRTVEQFSSFISCWCWWQPCRWMRWQACVVLVARCIHLRSNGGVGFHPDPTTRGVLGPTQGGTKKWGHRLVTTMRSDLNRFF